LDFQNLSPFAVEDPSENFQRVRDYVDAKNCSTLAAFDPKQLKKGFSDAMVTEARTKLKINKVGLFC